MAVALPFIAIGASVASGVVGAMGAAQKADSQTAMYNYKAGVAAANQKVAAQNAQYAMYAGGVKAQQAGLKGGQQLGQIKAMQGASGVSVSGGTADLLRESQQEGIRQNQEIAVGEGQRKAFGHEVEGMNFASEGRFNMMAGEAAQDAKGYDVASSLLGGATGVADKWYKFNQSGAFG